MPCQLRLPRLCDSRHPYHHIFRHAVTCRTARQPFQQLRHGSNSARESARTAGRGTARERARQDALRRLDEGIDPNDLSATLEAHRESNRASVIHCVPTANSDPELARPSFVDALPTVRVISTRRRRAGREYAAKDTSPLAEFSETVAKSTGENDAVTAYQLRRLQSAAELAREQHSTSLAEQQNGETYGHLANFLRKNEKPLVAEIAEYDPKDRRTFFELMRRVHSIISREQKKLKPTHILKSLASPLLLHYIGTSRPLMSGLKGYSQPEPWNRRPKTKEGYTHRKWFDFEIKKFAEWMQMTPSEEAARAKLTETLLEMVPDAAAGTAGEPFGSQVTGLTMPNSDIDIRIYEPNFKAPRQEDQQFADKEEKHAWQARKKAEKKARMAAHLSKVQSHLAKHPDFHQVERTDAHYPLVKAIHRPTGLKVQLVATKPSNSSRAAIKKYLEELPQLKPLYLLMKTTLNLRGLSDPWHGGFGSYTLFVMCVAALKSAAFESPKNNHRKSLSYDFLYILKFWAGFDTSNFALSVEPLLVYPKKPWVYPEEAEASKTDFALAARIRIRKPVKYKPYLLALQDPADALNDLGRSGLAIHDLQKTLKKLRFDLIQDLEDPTRKNNPSALLRKVVGRCDRYFDEMRIPVDLWGSQFVEDVQHGEAEKAAQEEAAQENMAKS